MVVEFAAELDDTGRRDAVLLGLVERTVATAHVADDRSVAVGAGGPERFGSTGRRRRPTGWSERVLDFGALEAEQFWQRTEENAGDQAMGR